MREIKLTEQMRDAVHFANTVKNEGFVAYNLAVLMTLRRAAFNANVKHSNESTENSLRRLERAQRELSDYAETFLGLTAQFNGLNPTFYRNGEEIRIPNIRS
jgi:DNA primase large subunit